MSIHTTVYSNIYKLDDLILVLDLLEIPWEHRETRQSGLLAQCMYRAIHARINGETVLIYQNRLGGAFVFQSEGWSFRNEAAAKSIALNGDELIANKKELEAHNKEEEERRIREMEARRQAEEAEQRRINEESESQRKAEEEYEKQRQAEIQFQVANVLQRLETERAAKRQERIKPNINQDDKPSSNSLESSIGKIHQQNALRKILESLETLDHNTGLSLSTHETLEDETIELTLRG